MNLDQWHGLLTNRFVCEACLTRFFTRHVQCPACHQWGRINYLYDFIYSWARDDQELRDLIYQGQNIAPKPQPQSELPEVQPDYFGHPDKPA